MVISSNGRISGYFQYPVFSRISGKANPVSGRIPDIKNSPIIRPDIQCILIGNPGKGVNILSIKQSFLLTI
jgi:hypothetical protein